MALPYIRGDLTEPLQIGGQLLGLPLWFEPRLWRIPLWLGFESGSSEIGEQSAVNAT